MNLWRSANPICYDANINLIVKVLGFAQWGGGPKTGEVYPKPIGLHVTKATAAMTSQTRHCPHCSRRRMLLNAEVAVRYKT